MSVGYTYVIERDQTATVVITSERVGRRAVSAAGQVSDPLEILAAANGKVSFEFSNKNEVALMTVPGMWHGVVRVEELLGQVQERIERWPTRRLIVCSVFETDKGIAAVSTGASQAVEIGVGAKGTVQGAVKVGGGLDFSVSWSQATGWMSPFSSPVGLPAQSSEPRSSKSTPLFGNCYRVRRKYWNRFGPRRIDALDALHGLTVDERVLRDDLIDWIGESDGAQST